MLYNTNYLITSETYWSQEIINKLTDCCLATLYMAVPNEATSYQDGGWLEAMWGEAVNLLVKSRQILDALMNRIHTCVVGMYISQTYWSAAI